ncbi:ATP-binding protein [Streptomyces anulatus]|uniref:ATP-binding protein n=1 Tax=Streptomyces anulatus TaxID=1892 RepID=UPI003687AAE6
MRRTQIELLTIQAVDRVLNGLGNEDSRIEFKSVWPEPEKYRQLAGHANSARGEEILWIIGVDEKGGRLTHPEPVDLATWWARMSKNFDGQVVPELADLQVPVEGGMVTALLFQTDRTPYVVNTKGGGGEKEIPIRDGTRTRSASRFEVLRLLSPAVVLPQCVLLKASANASERVFQRKRWQIDGTAVLYVDQKVGESTFFPLHEMQGLVTLKRDAEVLSSMALKLAGPWSGVDQQHGTTWRSDGALSDGPTALDVTFLATGYESLPREVLSATRFDLSMTLGVAGTDRKVRISTHFVPHEVVESPSRGLGTVVKFRQVLPT